MVEKTKRQKKKSLSLKFCYVASIIGFALVSFIVYFFSFDSRVHVLACEGNYYYTDKQIYEAANLGTDSRVLLTPSFLIENNLKGLSLIKDVSILKNGNKMTLKVEEANVVGYYVKGNKNYVLTIDNESIELDQKYLKSIVHFPLLSNFSDKQLKQITEQFKKYDDILTKEMISKIAEMVPFQTSYDDNMVKITMQDGNTVYSNMDSLAMMANYQSMLTQLKGQNVCLFLDGQHSTIDKVDCEQINKPREEPSEEVKEDEKEDQETTEENPEEQPVEEPEVPEDPYIQAGDWTTEGSLWNFEYSPSLDLYRDPGTGLYYRWNNDTQSFDNVE